MKTNYSIQPYKNCVALTVLVSQNELKYTAVCYLAAFLKQVNTTKNGLCGIHRTEGDDEDGLLIPVRGKAKKEQENNSRDGGVGFSR